MGGDGGSRRGVGGGVAGGSVMSPSLDGVDGENLDHKVARCDIERTTSCGAIGRNRRPTWLVYLLYDQKYRLVDAYNSVYTLCVCINMRQERLFFAVMALEQVLVCSGAHFRSTHFVHIYMRQGRVFLL